MEPRGPWAAHRIPAASATKNLLELSCNFLSTARPPRRSLIGSAQSSPRPPPAEFAVDRACPRRSAPAQIIWMVRPGQHFLVTCEDSEACKKFISVWQRSKELKEDP
ncbi:hypothetical protein PAHAL_4G328600 [Panicum hallii]|uniref:Uncharacterized protein n=1 Tax=Panicum hallii TaxID=206008 RepID=A0A2T8JET3_9POAL|nr:hypothetical protein PAHAL_4G328600 [Panicum hallii]PVH48434.1 hypothetical protein PAHAL_4G328600 [Panicum hallii]